MSRWDGRRGESVTAEPRVVIRTRLRARKAARPLMDLSVHSSGYRRPELVRAGYARWFRKYSSDPNLARSRGHVLRLLG